MLFNFLQKGNTTKRIHLDYASTTPVHKDVLETMLPYFDEQWANPSAMYTEGVTSRTAVESARTELARTLRVRSSDVTFTSGGTESNNLALVGLVDALHETGKPYSGMEIITTRVEHPSILETLLYLEKKGVVIQYVDIDAEGLIDIQKLDTLLTVNTALITFAYANSETGVVQDVKKISRLVRAWNEAHTEKILTHIDASQAPLWLSCELDMLGVDMMTLDAGKCYGPKGVGVLVHRHWVTLSPYMHGGGQEQGLRSGTENTPLIIGCVKAIVRAQLNYIVRSASTAALTEYFFERLVHEIAGVIPNGSRKARLANNVNISIPGLDTEYAIVWLDSKGVAASTKSACGSGDETGSSVVRNMTHDEARARATLRFTLGEESTKSEIDQTIKVLNDYIHVMARSV